MKESRTGIVRNALLRDGSISAKELRMIGFKNIYSPISYLRKKGWDLDVIDGKVYLVDTPEGKLKRKRIEVAKLVGAFLLGVLLLKIITLFI